MPEMGDDVGGAGKQPRPLLVHPPPRPAARRLLRRPRLLRVYVYDREGRIHQESFHSLLMPVRAVAVGIIRTAESAGKIYQAVSHIILLGHLKHLH